MISTHAPAKQSKGSGFAAVMFLSFFAIPAILSAFSATSSAKSLETKCIAFFDAEVPVLLLISALAFYYAGWMFKGVMRVLTRENDPLFSRGGGMGFLAAHVVIILGFAWSHFLPDSFPVPICAFWVGSLFPLLFIPLGSVRTFERYLEESSGSVETGTAGAGAFLRRSNLAYWMTLGVVWAIPSVIVGVVTGLRPDVAIFEAGVVLSFCLVLFLLLELTVVYMPIFSKIGVLVSVIVGILLFLPIILSGIFSSDSLYAFCLPGYLARLFGGDERGLRVSLLSLVLAYNLALSLVPLWLVFRRYQFIVSARRKM